MRLTNPWPSNSRSNWNLEMLIFVEGGKPENPEKNLRSKDENQQQTQVSSELWKHRWGKPRKTVFEMNEHCYTAEKYKKPCAYSSLLQLPGTNTRQEGLSLTRATNRALPISFAKTKLWYVKLLPNPVPVSFK